MRTQTIKILADYFESKGKILSAAEYKAETDTPVRFAVVKRTFGSWRRMENIVRVREQRLPAVVENDIDEVLALRFAAETENREAVAEIIEEEEEVVEEAPPEEVPPVVKPTETDNKAPPKK